MFLEDRLSDETRSDNFKFIYKDDFLLMGITTQDKEIFDFDSDSGKYGIEDFYSSDITYLGGVDDFTYVGELKGSTNSKLNNCLRDCIDWYNNARAVFVGKRVFAISANELIEGKFFEGLIKETDRLSLLPIPQPLIKTE